MAITIRKGIYCLSILFMIACDLNHYHRPKRTLQGSVEYDAEAPEPTEPTEHSALFPKQKHKEASRESEARAPPKCQVSVEIPGKGYRHMEVNNDIMVRQLHAMIQREFRVRLRKNQRLNLYLGTKKLDKNDTLADSGLSTEIKIESRIEKKTSFLLKGLSLCKIGKKTRII